VVRRHVTEAEKLIMLADSLGWPVIKEDYEQDDVLIQDGREYIWFKHKGGMITAASDNLGPKVKPLAKNVEDHIRERGNESEDHADWRRRAGLGNLGKRRRKR
jgi:hypothetical protein